MRKHKIIDSIFFYDELEMLYFRMSELSEYVDYFIIMESEIDFKGNPKPLIFKNNRDTFKDWDDKIIYLQSPSISFENIIEIYNDLKYHKLLQREIKNSLTKHDVRFFQISGLINLILSLDLTFDDIILISDVDEIPDLSKLKIIVDYIKFGPTVFRQKNFVWSTKYIDISPNMGTLCFQFTRLLTDIFSIYESYFSKELHISDHFDVINNGYHFSHFYDVEKTIERVKLLETNHIDSSSIESKIKYSFENLQSIKNLDDGTNNNLIEYSGELPKKIHLIKNQNIGREWSKNHLIILDENKPIKLFDTINFVRFTDNLSEKYHIQSQGTNTFNVIKPNEVYYGNQELNEFQKIFCINEIKKIINTLHPLNHDLITFNNNHKTLTFRWSQLKDDFIYDLIKDII